MADTAPVVVLDTGSFMCKVGFAGDEAPRAVFPSVVGFPKFIHMIPSISSMDHYVGDDALMKRGLLKLMWPIEGTQALSWDDVEKIWHHAMYHQLREAPEEHPFFLIDPPFSRSVDREKAIQILFETFNVPELYLSAAAPLSLLSTGRTTGLVLDSGHMSSCSTVVYEACALPYLTRRISFAGKDLIDYFVCMVNSRGYSFQTYAEREIVRDMKERLCYIALDPALEEMKPGETMYELPDSSCITLEKEPFKCTEALFQPSLLGKDFPGMHELILQSINYSGPDLRRILYKHIVLSGGNTMFPGLAQRLHKEIQLKLPSEEVHVVASLERKYGAWLGGSVMSSLTAVRGRFITAGEYEEYGPSIVHRKCV